jgi:hypothetical protein
MVEGSDEVEKLEKRIAALKEREAWHTSGEPEKQGFYLAKVGPYYLILHALGDNRGWTRRMGENPPKVIAWRHIPAYKE